MSLAWLVGPEAVETFLSDFWCREMFRVDRSDRNFYQTLLSETELEYILQTSLRASRGLEILVEGSPAIRPLSIAHAIDALHSGKSLRVDSIQRFSFSIMQLCRSLQLSIGAHINVNLYLTPGRGQRALSRHYDMHDVFVMQLFGTKEWNVYDPPVINPLEHLALQHHETPEQMRSFRLRNEQREGSSTILRHSFTMRPGDLLYLPRGFWHDAETGSGQVSCHLTIGVQPSTYLDLLTIAIGEAASRAADLRATLPMGYTYDEAAVDQMEAHLDKIVRTLPNLIDKKAAIGQTIETFLRSQRSSFENKLLSFQQNHAEAEITECTELRVAIGSVFGLDTTSAPARLISGFKTFEIPDDYINACRFILANGTFQPRDLPGDLPIERRIGLARQLVVEGFAALDTTVSRNISDCVVPNWIPVTIAVSRNSVQWIDLANQALTEPFLHQTVSRLRRVTPPVRVRRTPLSNLLKREAGVISPSGFILHISRCGSTVVSNEFRHVKGTIVVSEAQPFNELLSVNASSETQDVDALLLGLMNAYGQKHKETDCALVVKFSSWNLLHLDRLRRLWPHVPILIVVRDPLEVAVSCIHSKPGWMKRKKSDRRTLMVQAEGVDVTVTNEMDAASEARYVARFLGKLLEVAEAFGAGEQCRILDYSRLSIANVKAIGCYFGLDMSHFNKDQITSSYSKDVAGLQHFEPDGYSKQRMASDILRTEVERWAFPVYGRILEQKAAEWSEELS